MIGSNLNAESTRVKQGVEGDEKLHSKIDKLNRIFEDHLNSIEQPRLAKLPTDKNDKSIGQEIHATQRWWQLAYLRHLLIDLSFYIR